MKPRSWQRCLAELRQCESAAGRAALDGFSIEGLRLVERALRARAALEFVVLADSLMHSERPRERALVQALSACEGLELLAAPDAELTEFVQGRSFGALVGFVRRAPETSLARIFEAADADNGATGAVVLAAIDVQDPGNVGALVRTAHAAGACAFLAVGYCDPFHPKALRTSMGSSLCLPILTCAGTSKLRQAVKGAQATTLAAVSRGGTPLSRWRRSAKRLVLCLGSEAFGLPREFIATLDETVTIRQSSSIDSYSVNAAAAILLHRTLEAHE
ncbi:MAG: RNA methyltransferase [bacterium]|nr:hypothetical protein [Planctomycetota bacterium]HIL51742.1 hypothetical protein [Planctomycetota bacterium]